MVLQLLTACSPDEGLVVVMCVQGGGPVRLTNLLVWGVDLVEEHLMTRCISLHFSFCFFAAVLLQAAMHLLVTLCRRGHL